MSVRTVDTGSRPQLSCNPGPPPELRWIPVSRLILDDTYQRPLLVSNWRQITKIGSNFSWQRFGACQVAPAGSGKFAIIDGQHRAHAAALCGIREVPCMVVPMTLSEQAAAFSAINGTVMNITLFQVYRAAFAAREAWAVDAHEAVSAAGCTLMTSNKTASAKLPGEVYAIRLIAKTVEAGEAAVVTTGLAALKNSEHGADDPSLFGGSILTAWFRALATDQRFLKLDLKTVVDQVDLVELSEECRTRAKLSGGSRNAIAADRIRGLLRQVQAQPRAAAE
ncbi:ParB N-terminal domain-containing protein [Marinibacterium sp. SX1]|uniref:ParB N-terminal domain-containing protein n=1 Tax=Marinibacterium sp. SX1 TaxID=3388424 RepID=UPI003D182D7E